MVAKCPHCHYPVIAHNPNCTKHISTQVLVPKRAHMRKGAQINLNEIAAPLYVQAIMSRVSGIHPTVLAATVRELTVDFQKTVYCTNASAYEAGELFVALAYFGLGLTQSEIADHARHSTCWVQFRLRSAKHRFAQTLFVAKLRDIVLCIEVQRS